MISFFNFVLLCSLVCMKSAAGAKEKSVNLNLETVLEFDNKNLDSDVKIIDNVQQFLSKVRNVLDKSKNYRRSFNNDEEKNLKFTDFLEYVINHILTYNDKELEEIAVIIDEEIRKYHYKGCKFYELLENNDEFRDYVADVLEEMKHLRGKKLRKLLTHYVEKIKATDFQKKDLDLILYINSLYRVDSKDKMNNFIKEFEDFSKISRRNHKNLVKVIRKGLRSMIFDHYSNLNANERRDLKMKVSSYLIEYKPGKKSKGKIETYGTITEIEYIPTKSVKEKSKHLRHGRNREDETTTESDALMITPNRDLEEEKKMMPFRFISLYTEAIPTTTKKPKTTKKKRRKHKHIENKPEKEDGHSMKRERESKTTSKKAVKSLEQETEDSKTDDGSPEQKRELKSKKDESASEEESDARTKSKKPRVKSGHPKTVMVVREGRPLHEILTEHNAIIRVMSSRSPQQVRVKGLNRALRKIKKNREDKIKRQRNSLRVKPVDSEAKVSSEEKIQDKKSSDSTVKTKTKAKVKLVTRDARESKPEKYSHVKEEKPINVSKKTHKKASIKHGSRKSKQHDADNTGSFLLRAKADSDDVDTIQNLRGSASVKEDFSRKQRHDTYEVEEATIKDQQRKSFLDAGLPIESFENNVLHGYYEYRKQNQYDTFKSNKRSSLRKRNKGQRSRALDYRYRKSLPINENNEIEDIVKDSTISQKPTESKTDATKKVPALQTQPLKLDDQTPLTDAKLIKLKNNDTKVKFRSRYSDEKTESTTVAFVSDNYIINKINNLEKQLEVVIDKMDERNDRANNYDSIEHTTKYQEIPYWKGTPKTARPSSSSSSSSSEESSENGTLTLSNNNTSANLTISHNSDITTAAPAVAKSDEKTGNATLQVNNTSNNPNNGTKVDKSTENASNNTDGRKQGLHVDKSDEITTDKPSTVDSEIASLNVSNTTSVEKEGTTRSDNALVTAVNNNSTDNDTSTTKDDTSDKISEEPSDTNAKSTKTGLNFRDSEDDLKEDKKSAMKSKSKKDKIEQSDKEAKSTKKEAVNFRASEDDLEKDKKSTMKSKSKKDKNEQSDKEAKSTKKEAYFRASENGFNEDTKSKKKLKPKKDKLSTKFDDSTLKLSPTGTTSVKTTKIKTNETLKQDINSTIVNATNNETRNDQTTIEMTTDTTLRNKSTTISTKHGMKFTFSIANVNITSGNKGIEDNSKNNSTSKKNRRMGRRRNFYANPFDSDNDRLKTDREMDDTLYNWA